MAHIIVMAVCACQCWAICSRVESVVRAWRLEIHIMYLFQWFFTLVPVTLSYWSWSLSIQLDWLPSKFHGSLILDSLALELQVNATIPNFKICAYCVHILYVYVYSIKIELKHFSLPFLFHPPYIPSLDLFPCSHIIKLIAFFSWIIIVTHAYMCMQNYVCDSCFNQLLYNF